MIEAQYNGLQCIATSNIPNEAIISDKVLRIELDVFKWEKAICELSNHKLNREIIMSDNCKKFDIMEQVKVVEQIYNI